MRRRRSAVALLGVALGWGTACNEPAPLSDTHGIRWYHDHDAALKVAAQKKLPVLVEFTADWCLPCQELERQTYPSAEVQAEARRFVMVKLDATKLGSGEMPEGLARLTRRYKVSGLPTIVFVGPDGKVRERPRITGFLPPAQFVREMRKVSEAP